jgi:hypothetical protein
MCNPEKNYVRCMCNCITKIVRILNARVDVCTKKLYNTEQQRNRTDRQQRNRG